MTRSDKSTDTQAQQPAANVVSAAGVASATTAVAGRNGVVIRKLSSQGKTGYRTYEVHQRERVGESTEKLKPIELISEAYRLDPYPVLSTLRENYPCYRDWLGNRYWLTQYNDVTSVFADDANFETRSRAWHFGGVQVAGVHGRDLGDELPVLEHLAKGLTTDFQASCDELLQAMQGEGQGDLAQQFAARLPLLVLARSLDIPVAERENFYALYWRLQRGTSWQAELRADGQRAATELATYFKPLLAARRETPGDDLLSVLLHLEGLDEPLTAQDVVVTLLEMDHQTMHGGLANLWHLLLSHPQELELARQSSRAMKMAFLEALRHSAPVLSAQRFTRHEVERFGKLLPAGSLVECSAAAANRDPRIFAAPDEFRVERADLCQREPRGQYRADGLASGLAFALGPPSKHPAIPEDRPPSRYALTRDAAATASMMVLEQMPDLARVGGTDSRLAAVTVGEMHTCWSLPVRW